jgi:general secretion pathway protein K
MTQSQRQGGFVLVLTLWVLAAIAIVIGTFAERIARDIQLARNTQNFVQSRIDISSTRADILYRLATTPMTQYGLGPYPPHVVELDGRPYQGEGKTHVRLQDDRGLVDLNLTDDDGIDRLLGIMGIPFDDRTHLADTLKDYIDTDDLRRLSGAERRDYPDHQKSLPRNEKLLTPMELRQVLDWTEYPQLMQDGKIFEYTTSSQASAVNPITAPWPVLSILPGMTPELAQNLVLQRSNHPDINLWLPEALRSSMGTVIEFPSDSIRITHYLPDSSWAYRYDVTLTPNAEDRPWRVNYTMNLQRQPKYENATAPAQLPEKSAIPQDTGQSILPF